MCVAGREVAGFRNRAALGSGQAPTIFIRYYYFYGKRNLQRFRLSYLPSGVGLSNLGPVPVEHSGCSWVACVCVCVSVCSGVCVTPSRCESVVLA